LTAVGEDTQNKALYITVNPLATAPTANFSATPTNGFAPLSVQFTDQCVDGGAAIVARSWSFGDGDSSSVVSPSHTYATPGSYTVALTATNSVGRGSITRSNFINAEIVPVLPTAQFSGTPTSGFAPLTVQFTDQSAIGTSPITSWAWSFGDGGTSNVQNPAHSYASPGAYSVSLKVTTAVGADSTTRADYVNAALRPVKPTAAFSGTPTTGFAPLSVQFSDESVIGTSPITTWAWKFGDGGTSTSQNPSHSYAAPGTYDVALTVTSAAGADSTVRAGYITAAIVPVPPTAAFSGTPTSGFVPLRVQFTDESTPGTQPITSWAWSFGDGGISSSQSPSHTYATPGRYSVRLIAANSVGPDTTTRVDYITPLIVPVPPTAAFSGTPTSGDAPLTVQFTDESTAGTSPITSRSWNFGDASTSTEVNPSHTYTTPGTYAVSLSVATAAGDDSENKASYIQALVPPTAPLANFSGTPTNGFAPLPVQFTDLSGDGGAAIGSWSWTFGDGGTSTQQNPSHTYAAPGTYNVSLTATNTVGPGSTTKTGYITAEQVPRAPTAAFSGTPASGFAPLLVQFTDGSAIGTQPITSWAWSFGDGGTSTSQNPGHSYASPGSYTVSLRVANSVGPDSTTKTNYITAIQVPVPPTAAFTGTPTTGDAPLTVQFTDESTAGTAAITSWAWTFGDGGTSTEQNPSHTYATPGTYTVTLTATNSVGPGGTTKTGYITATAVPPTAAFTGTPTAGAPPLIVQFTDQSTAGTAAITGRSWNFGDGTTSTETDPSHIYLLLGSYTVELTVTTADGTDTETKSSYIQVTIPPLANFSAFPTGGNAPLSAPVPVAPIAQFSGTPLTGEAPVTVQFTDLSVAGTSPIIAWLWSFGDGDTSIVASPSHIYTAPGSYTVVLSVLTNDGEDREDKAFYITVVPPAINPDSEFSATQRREPLLLR